MVKGKVALFERIFVGHNAGSGTEVNRMNNTTGGTYWLQINRSELNNGKDSSVVGRFLTALER